MSRHIATGRDSFQGFYIRKLFFLKEKLNPSKMALVRFEEKEFVHLGGIFLRSDQGPGVLSR